MCLFFNRDDGQKGKKQQQQRRTTLCYVMHGLKALSPSVLYHQRAQLDLFIELFVVVTVCYELPYFYDYLHAMEFDRNKGSSSGKVVWHASGTSIFRNYRQEERQGKRGVWQRVHRENVATDDADDLHESMSQPK